MLTWIVQRVHLGFSLTSYKKSEQTFSWPNTYSFTLFRFFSRFRVLLRVSVLPFATLFLVIYIIDNWVLNSSPVWLSKPSGPISHLFLMTFLSYMYLLAKSSPSQCIEATPWELPQAAASLSFLHGVSSDWVSFQLCTNELWLGCSLPLLVSIHLSHSWDRLSSGLSPCALPQSFALLTPPLLSPCFFSFSSSVVAAEDQVSLLICSYPSSLALSRSHFVTFISASPSPSHSPPSHTVNA